MTAALSAPAPARGYHGRYLPGYSGNPKGKPRRQPTLAERLDAIAGPPETWVQLLVGRASAGDCTAAGLLLARPWARQEGRRP